MVIGVEIGGTKLQVGVCDGRGQVQVLDRADVVRKPGRTGILAQLRRMLPGVIQRYQPSAIGVGFGGPVDAPRGKILTSHQIRGWDGFLLRQWLTRCFKLPAIVENDSNCAGLAEAVCGAGRGKRRVFYFNVGTGIGGAMIIDGRIDGGRYGGAELGHTRVRMNRGAPTLESLASGLAIERGAVTVRQSARRVGLAVANAITLLNPEIVVVGGGVARAGRIFWTPMRKMIEQMVFGPFSKNFTVVPAALGDDVVVVGAALVAAEWTRTKSRTRTSKSRSTSGQR